MTRRGWRPVRCPSCSLENRDDAKFCSECGTRLALVCPSCGSPVRPAQRFCDECGAALTPPAEPDGAPAGAPPAPAVQHPVAERRLVSVLFADLVGFTTLSESRDSEAVRELLSRYFDTARTIVGRYGGTVEKFIGDAVMAVWGVPTAHGDDAERSVRAALELVAAVGALGAEVGSDLSARAGVVTGEVAVTLGATGQGMVAGDAVNTAARVQAAAEPGSVLVDDVTRQATSVAIAYVDAGQHSLKGKSDTLHLWRAARVVATVRGAERVDGLEASFLGRDRELRGVKDRFHATLDDSRAHLVSVVGAAGVGKSRLRWEFEKYLDGLVRTVLWHTGRCLPYGEGVAYWGLAEIVRARLGVSEEESPEQVAQKLAAGLDRWVPDAGERSFLRPRLGALLGTEEPGLGREELFAGWRLWFERLADHDPVVLVIEDLHWADAALLDFVEHLLDWSADHPIFVLTLARPELSERRPTWAAGRRNATSVALDPLTPPVMSGILDELVPGLADDVRSRIVTQADGIPLYAVELIRSLVDRDIVQPVGGSYRLVGEVDSIDVPPTLSSLLAARLDGLAPDERALVQNLAVLGGTFPRAAVAAVADVPAEEVDRLLSVLVRKEILIVRTDRLSPDRGQYGFSQSLLRQVAYETLSRRDRKGRHLAVAAHLRATFPDDGAEIAEVVAQHYLDAYAAVPDDDDVEEIRSEAVTAFARAGQRATAVGAPEAAERAYRSAADLATAAARRAELFSQAGEAAVTAARGPAIVELFEAASAAYREAGDERAGAYAWARSAHGLAVGGRLDEAGARLEDALGALSEGEPDAALADVHAALAGNLLFSGRADEVPPHLEAALELGQALELPKVLSLAANFKGLHLQTFGRFQEGVALMEWSAELAEAAGLAREAMNAHLNAGDVCKCCDLPGAVEHTETAVELSRRRGDVIMHAVAVSNLALIHLFGGRWDEATGLIAGLLADDRAGGDYFRGAALILAALRGDADEAVATLSRMSGWAAADTDQQEKAGYAACSAFAAWVRDDLPEALERAQEAVRVTSEAFGVRHDFIRLAWPLAMDTALSLGRLDEAERLLAVVGGLRRGHVPPYLRAELARFRARLAAARGEESGVEEGFAAAATALRDLGYPFFLASVLTDHAEWLLASGRQGEAAVLLDEAAATFEQLGAQPALRRARLLLSQLSSAPVG